MNKHLFSWAGLLIAVVLLIAINVFASAALRSARIDLTEQKLFTLSDGTRSILGNIEEPIDITFYYSEGIAAENAPMLDAYATRVREMLEEYRDAAGGNLRLNVVEPQPFSEEEDAATLAGLQGVPVNNAGDSLFFGLVANNSVDESEAIPFLDQRREQFLEYDLSRIVYDLTNTEKTVVGVMTELPVMGDSDPMAALQNPQGYKQPWMIVEQLRELYEVREVGTGVAEIDEDVSVLLVIHPKDFSRRTQYAIDQFVLGGGRLILFVDPYCEADEPPADPQNPYARLWAPRASDLPVLLENWGVELVEDRFLGDRQTAVRINARNERGLSEPVDYVGIQRLMADQLNQDDLVTTNVGDVIVGIPGALQIVEGAETNVEALVSSTEDAMLIDLEKIKFQPNPRELLSEFEPSGEQHPIVVRVSGSVKTAFPGGRYEDELPEGEDFETPDDHLETSSDDVNVLVFADADLLNDPYWVQVQNFFGQRMAFPISQNPALLLNGIENLSGSSDLISVRSRGNTTREFALVKEIQRDAEARYREREQELLDNIEEIEGKLREIQTTTDEAGQVSLYLTPEQKSAIDDYQAERVNARKELRNVRYELNKDIERLGTTIKVVNIGAIPLIVAIFAVVLGIIRVQRRRP